MRSWTWLLSGRRKRGCRFVRHEPSVLAAYSTYKDLFLNFLKFFQKFFKKVLDELHKALKIWLIGQVVKTSPSHGEDRGSTPL